MTVYSFAEKTAALLTQPYLRRDLAEAAYERSQTYHWEAVLARVAGYYQQVLAGRAAGGRVPTERGPAVSSK